MHVQGAHQGIERADIHYSTGNLRQCKASSWEGGIRVPGMIHIPWVILENKNISTPTTTADFLPTIMSIFQVESDNPPCPPPPRARTHTPLPRCPPILGVSPLGR